MIVHKVSLFLSLSLSLALSLTLSHPLSLMVIKSRPPLFYFQLIINFCQKSNLCKGRCLDLENKLAALKYAIKIPIQPATFFKKKGS